MFLWLFSYLDFGALRALSQRQLIGLFLGTVVFVLCAGFEGLRVKLLAGAEATYRTMLSLTLVAHFFANLLPTNMGGDAYRVFALSRYKPLRDAGLLIVLDRVAGLVVLVGVAVLFSLWVSVDLIGLVDPQIIDTVMDPSVQAAALVTCLSLIALLLVGPMRSLIRQVLRYIAQLLRSSGRATLVKLLLTVFGFHGVRAIALVMLAGALGSSLLWPQAWIALAVAAVVSMAPVTVAGLGLREAALGAVLALFGVPLQQALICGLMLRIASVFQAATGGLLLLILRPTRGLESRSDPP